MRTGWESASIGDTCDVVNGGTPKTGVAEYWGGPHRWITPAEMGKRFTPYIDQTDRTITDQGLQNSSARTLPPYSVILSSRAPIGHLVINTEPMATNQGCKGLVPRGRIDHKFLYYYLGSIVDLLNDLGTGATFKELSGGKLKDVQVPVPPLQEQRRIVAILDEAFEGIATAKANVEKSLQNARELFEGYLGVTFSQDGEAVQLSKCATDISDGDHAPPPKSQTGVPFITISNVDKETRRIDFNKTFMVSREYFQALKRHRKPRRGDVLYTVTGSFGIPVLVEDDDEFCFQRHIGLIRPKPDVDSRWLMYALLSPQVRAQAEAGATGTAQRTVSLGVLRAMTIPKVGIEEQRRMAAQIDALSNEVVRLKKIAQAKLIALDELKKSLLHQAFTGQLTSAKPTSLAQQPAVQTTTPEFAANVIAFAHARHERQKRDKTFGHVKAQKVLHLVEAVGKIDLGRHPMKDAAGPNDFQHMLQAKEWAKVHNFFDMVKRGEGYEFRKLSAFDARLSSALRALDPYLRPLERVIDLLVPMDKVDAEVFATVHAAWSNLVIEGAEVTDEAIVSAAREDWHADKLDIPEHKFRTAIALIRQKGLVPDGTAKYVGGQQSLL